MSSVEIRKVETKKDLKAFIEFHYDLYEGNEYDVPPLYSDDYNTLSRDRNAAFDFCEAEYYLAYKSGKIVGRVAAIINHKANKRWDRKSVRFGWIDFIDDYSVSAMLLDTVAQWGKEQGMNAMQGPMGFIDFDREGMLIEGFDRIGTMSTHYNYPYYPEHMKRYGLEKEIDWMERKVMAPAEVPEKFARIAQIAAKRSNLHIKKLKSMKEVHEKGYGKKIFDLINESYAPLFGYSRLSDKKIQQLIDTYLPLIDLRMQTLIMNEKEELVCVGLSMPSIVHALQKSGGKLFPFGWWHLLKETTSQR